MPKIIDRTLAILLCLGAVGHTYGAITAFRDHPATLLWALCASVVIVLVGALNLLRSWRPGDAWLASLAAAGTLCWLIATVAFGIIIGNLTDPRVIIFLVLTVGLLAFSVKDAVSAPGYPDRLRS